MTTSLEECRKMAPGYGMVPVVKRVPAGGHTVEDLAEMARSLSKQVYVMDHTVDTGKEIRWERYAVIGFAPALDFSCTDGVMTVAQGRTRISYPCKDPSRVLAGVLAAHKAPYAAGMPPFTGGLAGYFAYEYIKYAEPEIQWEEANPEQFKDMDLFFFDRLFVLDRQQQEIVPVNINTATEEELIAVEGIGPALARRIIAYREENGPFQTIDELDNVKGIGPSLIENIRYLVCTEDKK